MAKKPIIIQPRQEEFAPSTPDLDPGKAYSQKLAIPEDTVLTAKGGGQYLIYKELLRDDQIRSTYQQRRLALVSKDIEVFPGKEGDPAAEVAAAALKANIQSLDWDRITDKMHYGVFYGFAVSELIWRMKDNLWQIDNIKTRERGRFRWGAQERELYLLTRQNPQGALMQTDFDANAVTDRVRNPHGPAFWAYTSGADHDDDPYGLGLAHSLYWHCFFKRQDIRFWLKFLEKYASPTAQGKAPSGKVDDAAERKKILEVLGAIVNDAAVVVPEWLEVSLIEAQRSGTVDYDKMREMADRAMAKVILGQTMTSEQEGGQYKADVAKDVRDELIEADADTLANSFNSGPAVWFTLINFGEGVPSPRIHWKTEQEEDKKERAERDEKIHSLGFDPTPEYVEETYGPGWEKRAATIPPAFQPQQTPQAPSFAESLLADAMRGHRGDQVDIKSQAQLMGREFRDILGPRVDELLGYLEETDDLQTFRRKLVELMAEQPSPDNVDRLQRQGFTSRLMGLFRHQR